MRTRTGYCLLCALLLLSLTGPLGPASMASVPSPTRAVPALTTVTLPPPAKSGPVLVEADARHIVVEWVAPAYQLTLDTVEGRLVDRISIPACPSVGKSGEPELPGCPALLGVPPDVRLKLYIKEDEGIPVPGSFVVPPVPTQTVEEQLPPAGSESVQVTGQRWEEGSAYSSDSAFPAQPALLGEPAFLRHQRLVAINFYPFQYQPRSGKLVYHSRVRIELTFTGGSEPTGFVAEPADFERLLENNLLNYSQAQEWRRTTAAPMDLPPPPPDPGWRIPVQQDGIYLLTYQQLQQSGVPVDTLDPRTLKLFRYGQEMPIQVTGEADGHFNVEDMVLFYGQSLKDNRYSNTEVYWLTFGSGPGQRMAHRNGPPSGGPVPSSFVVAERSEQNLLYRSQIPWRPDHDHWLWSYTYPPYFVQQNFSFPPHYLADEPYTVTLRLHLYSFNTDPRVNPDHHLRIFFNNTQVDNMYWDGRAELTPTISFPSSLLQSVGNVVRVEAPGDTGVVADLVFYDWTELRERRRFVAEGDQLAWQGDPEDQEYRLHGFTTSDIRLFDVTTPDSPSEILQGSVIPTGTAFILSFADVVTRTTAYLALTGRQFRSPDSITAAHPADLYSPTNGADYLVVTHRDFYTQALALAAFRSNDGLRTAVIDVRDVYDLFSYGRQVAEGIRNFVTYAYGHWAAPAPSYLVLLGDGTYDPKRYLGYNSGEYILPYLAWTDPWIGEVVSNNRYVCVSGEDRLPDLHLGLLPANSSAQAQTMVDKVVAYESAPPPGEWRAKGLFVADNADSAGDFAMLSDNLLARYYPSPYQSEQVYLGITHPYENPSVAARNAILAAINQGRLLINYIGHGGTFLWSAEFLLDNSALANLSNSPYLPVVLGMTCNEGFYVDPNPALGKAAVAEVFLRTAGKGWAASWSAAGNGVATGHDFLNDGFFHAVFFDDVRQLGPATMAGKLRLFESGSAPDLLDTYLLFGDPALEMPLLQTNLSLSQAAQPATPILPGDTVTFTLALANAGPATAHHVVLTDVLSPLFVGPIISTTGVTVRPRPGTRYVWDVEDMTAGQAATVRVVAQLNPHAPPGYVTNRAVVGTSASETDVNDNAASASWLVTVGPPYAITATASPPTLPADGTSLATIRAEVVDLAGNPVADGTTVTMHTGAGTFFDGTPDYQGQTTGGVATAHLQSSTLIETAELTITAGQAGTHLYVPFVPMAPATVAVLALPGIITPTGAARVTATVQDAFGHEVADGTAVSFATSLGTITPAQGSTVDGRVSTTLYADGRVGLASLLAWSGDVTGTAAVQVVPDAPAVITVTTAPPFLPADGVSLALVHAQVVDSSGNPVADGTPVTMTTNAGTFYDGSPIYHGVTLQGGAEAVLLASTLVETATVVAYAEPAWGQAAVPFVPMAPHDLTVMAAPPVITLTGATSLTVSVVDALGHPVADGAEVFLATSLGEVSPVRGITVDGRVQATLRGTDEPGMAVVTARSGAAANYALVQIGAGSDMSLALAVDPSAIPADGSSQATVRATLCWANGDPITESTWVSFTTTMGDIPSRSLSISGTAVVSLTAGTTMGQAVILARMNPAAAAVVVRLTAGPPATVTLTTSPDTLPVGGAYSLLVATVSDELGHPVGDGTPVSLTGTLGTVAPTATLTFGGRAHSTILSGQVAGTAAVTATSGTARAAAQVHLLPLAPATLTLDISPTILPADGVSTATVTTWTGDRFGNPVQDGTTVHFLTDRGHVVPTETQSLAGYATATLVAGRRLGQATVRAVVEGIQAQSTVSLVAGPPAVITVTALPEQVPVDGQQSLLTIAVRDAWNHPVADGTPVLLACSLGAVTPTAVPSLGGNAFSVLQSGSLAGTSVVTATVGAAVSNTRVVFTPLAPFTLTLAADPPVLPADGVSTATLSAWVADRLGNPVQDGTAVQFMASHGQLAPTLVGTSAGRAVTTLTAGMQVVTATVQAMVGDLQEEVPVPMVVGPPASVWVSVLPGRLFAGGLSTATVSVQVRDSGGHPVVDDTPVTLTTSLGTLTPTTALSQDGWVHSILHAGTEPGWATVRAFCGTVGGEAVVEMYRYTSYLMFVFR